jgi:hypothetical protein
VGERCDERLQLGPLKEPKALEVKNTNGDARSVLLAKSEDLLGRAGSDPGSSHDGEGVESPRGRTLRLENGLSQEGDQTIRSPFCADLQLDGVGSARATDDEADPVLRMALNRPPVSLEGFAEQSFGPAVALGAWRRIKSQYSPFS